jgi:hypothetical protein
MRVANSSVKMEGRPLSAIEPRHYWGIVTSLKYATESVARYPTGEASLDITSATAARAYFDLKSLRTLK